MVGRVSVNSFFPTRQAICSLEKHAFTYIFVQKHSYIQYNLLQFPAEMNTKGNKSPTTFILPFTQVIITRASDLLMKTNFCVIDLKTLLP